MQAERRETIKAWATKYALTAGIQEVEGEIAASISSDLLVVRGSYPHVDQHFNGEGREWHRTRAAAAERAEKMRLDKIALLKKQIAKLEKLRFDSGSPP